jgi:L-histidine N-alpha-methyltransferase
VLAPGDGFLVGVDLVKDAARLHAAYNDSRGVTAEFNRNILRVVNAVAGADFVPERFDHRAFYDREEHWIEMRLRSSAEQRVRLAALGQELEFRRGEEILTEISAKYDRPRLEGFLAASGFRPEEWFTDAEELFALVLARRE